MQRGYVMGAATNGGFGLYDALLKYNILLIFSLYNNYHNIVVEVRHRTPSGNGKADKLDLCIPSPLFPGSRRNRDQEKNGTFTRNPWITILVPAE